MDSNARTRVLGSLQRFSFSETFVKRFPNFVETGYGRGRSFKYALEHEFKSLWSIEIWKPHYNEALQTTHDPRAHIILGDSRDMLGWVLKQVEGPVFFWLDAHFPGGDFGGQPWNMAPMRVRMPLEDELSAIRRERPDGDYCILIDDLRLYKDDAWADGPLPKDQREFVGPMRESLDFIDHFAGTHDLFLWTADAGYAVISPSGAPIPTPLE